MHCTDSLKNARTESDIVTQRALFFLKVKSFQGIQKIQKIRFASDLPAVQNCSILGDSSGNRERVT